MYKLLLKKYDLKNIMTYKLFVSASALGPVSALAFLTRTYTSPLGWDTGYDHIHHAIFYM